MCEVPGEPAPLTDEEIAFFNGRNHVWCEPGLGSSSVKTGPLSAELKRRLVLLGEVYGLTVEFPLEPKWGGKEDEQQHFVRGARKKTAP